MAFEEWANLSVSEVDRQARISYVRMVVVRTTTDNFSGDVMIPSFVSHLQGCVIR
jgi:hypothetical protein